MPEFTEEEKTMIKGSYDFMGINHYTSQVVTPKEWDPKDDASYFTDSDTVETQPKTWDP